MRAGSNGARAVGGAGGGARVGAGGAAPTDNCRFCVVFTGNLLVDHDTKQCSNTAFNFSIRGAATQDIGRFIKKHTSPGSARLSATAQQRKELLVKWGMSEDCEVM